VEVACVVLAKMIHRLERGEASYDYRFSVLMSTSEWFALL